MAKKDRENRQNTDESQAYKINDPQYYVEADAADKKKNRRSRDISKENMDEDM